MVGTRLALALAALCLLLGYVVAHPVAAQLLRLQLRRPEVLPAASGGGDPCPDATVGASANPQYWAQLHEKFGAIQLEVQEKSRSMVACCAC